MKRAVFIVVCVLGIISFASCRSTSSSCGLADNLEVEQLQNEELEQMLFV
jgi:hypothetical protein